MSIDYSMTGLCQKDEYLKNTKFWTWIHAYPGSYPEFSIYLGNSGLDLIFVDCLFLFFPSGCVYLCSLLPCTFVGWVLIIDFYLQGFFFHVKTDIWIWAGHMCCIIISLSHTHTEWNCAWDLNWVRTSVRRLALFVLGENH